MHKTCLKFQKENEPIESLNVVYNPGSNMVVLWNKYQLFLIDDQDLFTTEVYLSKYRLIYHTDFIIHYLTISNNYIFCLDDEGTLRCYSLKFKQKFQKKPKNCFFELDHNVASIYHYNDLLYCTILNNSGCSLKIYKTSFQLDLNTEINIAKYHIDNLITYPFILNREQCVLLGYKLNISEFNNIKQIFKETKCEGNAPYFIIISFDKLTLYAVLIDLESGSENLKPIKLFTCPSEINNVQAKGVDLFSLIIGLNTGTIIKLCFSDGFICPKIAHLNTGIHKFLPWNTEIIYTDGITMWTTTNIFTEFETSLRQMFVRQTKDFIKIGDKIICTTFSKLVYIFDMNSDSSYLSPVFTSEYSSVEVLLSNIHYMHRIMAEIEKNDAIIKQIKKEESYITTLALSNRQDLLNDAIKYNINVYDNYDDILKKGLVLHLTNKYEEYFDKNSFIFLLKIDITSLQQHFENIFSESKIHITISSMQFILKTITIKMLERLNTLNIAIPGCDNKIYEADLTIEIKIVKEIPKIFDKQNLLIMLYYNKVSVPPENFIKTSHNSNDVTLLKDPVDTIDTLVYESAYKHHGNLFTITKVTEDILLWSFYVKLPHGYRDLLQNNIFFENRFNSATANFFIKELSLEDFLRGEKNMLLHIGNEKLHVNIKNDEFSNHYMISVSCASPFIGLHMRNFFSCLIYNDYQRYLSGKEFLSCDIFQSLAKIEQAVDKCILDDLPFEEFLNIYKSYQILMCSTLI